MLTAGRSLSCPADRQTSHVLVGLLRWITTPHNTRLTTTPRDENGPTLSGRAAWRHLDVCLNPIRLPDLACTRQSPRPACCCLVFSIASGILLPISQFVKSFFVEILTELSGVFDRASLGCCGIEFPAGREHPGAAMKIRTVYFKVSDMNAAVKFYTDFFGQDAHKTSGVWSEFLLGEVRLGLLTKKNGERTIGSNCVPVFEFNDDEIQRHI